MAVTWNRWRRATRRGAPAVAVAASLVLGGAVAVGAPATTARAQESGAYEEFVLEDPRILESSGLQASHRHPGVYWTHNDSDYPPEIYGVDSVTGRTVATVTLQGVEFRDVEAIHLGPDGDLYVGDIGDNLDGGWPHVWIYRFAEPAELADTTLTPTVYTVQYDDGPRDAEALMVDPVTGLVHLASKKRDGSGAVYRQPDALTTEGVNTFTRLFDTDLWVTDGAFSPDGSRLLLRGYFGAELFRWSDGAPDPIGLVRVPLQPQGESVTFTPDGTTLMFGSEGERSRVTPVELEGDQRPDDVIARQEAADEDGSGGPAAGDAPGGVAEDGILAGLLGRTALYAAIALAGVVLLGALLRARTAGGGRRRR
ncbi:hypothetical protein [Streptomyces bohaiensis]|uniref:WD40 repeat domain-containing protein n=1 Tax=Streptomyces bohaiensis TaxID=1431344 RepID=A0ABX1CH63_9ACTN|nr:hypothetical protein [Streptomyces bohaiensis]NJQ15784.1 hypothetical protein [Streptomyces bohaiensis]